MSHLSKKMNAACCQIIVMLCALALMAGALAAPAAARAVIGVASAVIPQALLGDAQTDLEIISVGDEVDQDVLIETGKRGRTQVLFVDGSSMNIGPSSRLVIDEFVFDPAQLRGGLGARLEKGSMKFIGGVLSKRTGQVKFDAGQATVGIRGGIAKISVQPAGQVQAELVHGRMRVVTPEGVFETNRIGTLIERDVEGVVATRSVTAAEVKERLDEEASENLLEPTGETSETNDAPSETAAANDETAEANAETAAASQRAANADSDESATQEDAVEVATQTGVEADAQTDVETEAPAGAVAGDVTGDVLLDDPINAGLVKIGEDGKLTASSELEALDPEAAKLINDGAVVIDNEGNIVPTEKILALNPTAQKMFAEGLLEVDENGFLVLAENFASTALYEDSSFDEPTEELVSDVTLREFGFEEPAGLTREEEYKANLVASRSVLSTDRTTATLYKLGQLTIDETGLLVPSDSFDSLVVARAKKASQLSASYIDDNVVDQLLLRAGAFDTKVTTRVVGVEIATDIYDENIAQVVSADIAREDAIIVIDKLAAANQIAVPEDISDRSLDELVALGDALTTRDALKTSSDEPIEAGATPLIEIDTKDGEVVLRTLNTDEINEVNADKAFTALADGTLDPELTALLVSPDELAGHNEQRAGEKTAGEVVVDDAFIGVDASRNVAGVSISDDKQLVIDVQFDVQIDSGEDYAIGQQEQEAGSDDKQLVIHPQYDSGQDYDIAQQEKEAGTQDLLVREQAEDIKETTPVKVAEFYRLSLAGQRQPKGISSWGDAQALYWSAYTTGIAKENALVRYGDNSVQMTLEAGYNDNGNSNLVAVRPDDTLGQASSLLAVNNLSFTTAVHAIINSTIAGGPSSNSQSETQQRLTTNTPSTLQSQTDRVAICDCNQVATGLWTTASFTDAALQNITYQHEGHWAIGSPLSADAIRSLAGMQAQFSGHAYGTVTTATGTANGFGEVNVAVDFANPSATSRNVWSLSNFAADNLNQAVSTSVPIRVDDSGRYIGRDTQTIVDGGLYGTTSNLQTAGTFTINQANDYAISGSFAGRGVATASSGASR